MHKLKEKQLVLNQNFEFEKIENSVMLFNVVEKKMVTLNETAGRIIELVKNPISYDDFWIKFKNAIIINDENSKNIQSEVDEIVSKMIDEKIIIIR